MAGTLLVYGQEWVLDRMLEYINTSGLYVGLMSQSTSPSQSSQIEDGIIEIAPSGTGSGYVRQLVSGWVKTTGINPYITGPEVTFTVSGIWSSVNGYFVSMTSGNTALWAESFTIDKRGDRSNGDTIIITPRYEQKDDSE